MLWEAAGMAVLHPLPVTVNGNIFNVDNAWYSEEEGANPQSITLRVNDQSGAWIDVNIDRNDGVRSTGHINNNDSGGFTESLQLYRTHKNPLTRWRPGFLSVPGGGGGGRGGGGPGAAGGGGGRGAGE